MLGRIAAPHGVRGAVKVQPYSADPAALLDHATWWIRRRSGEGAWTQYRVLAARRQGSVLVAELAGITSREAGGSLRGSEVGIPRERLPALGENEYYEADLIGMTVVNRGGEVLGTVSEFVASGAHPVVRVAAAGGGERLIPWVAHYIDHVDPAARRVEVDWPVDY